MTGLVYAAAGDASPFLARFAQGRWADLEEGDVAHRGRLLVMITGTGKVKATLHTERLLHQYDVERLLHVGMSTGLTDQVEIGALVTASAVLEGDRIALSAPSYPQMPLSPHDELPTGRLVTHDHEIAPDADEGYWQRLADMSDTTGYAVAYVAAQHGVPCQIVKAITGRLGHEQGDFQETLLTARATLTDFIFQAVEATAD